MPRIVSVIAFVLWTVGSARADQPPFSVNVLNTPLPVAVQGQVAVAPRVPVFFQQQGVYCTPFAGSCDLAYTVPQGQRLVIEQIYFEVTVEQGAPLTMTVTIVSDSLPNGQAVLPILAARVQSGIDLGFVTGPSDMYLGSSGLMRAYAPAGAKVWISSYIAAPPTNRYDSLSHPYFVGYLEPAQ